ncbi:hypothetical protein D5018_19115 [Parashewanella curva]|uniref:Uncharacterized protein n=1 Tax=Parashewanella curva TaxID=2338552 RepID=A0A3L8PS70_9GAMM|nr:hypothetical protein [Parashewanella curva]RLV58084.1 hypothetical protein D5018_19115 [Parashewanella curva]
MKTLLLLAALTAPAMADDVHHFGDWVVITDNGKITAFSSPLNTSSNQFSFSCNTNHQHCAMSNTRIAKTCKWITVNRWISLNLHENGASPRFDSKTNYSLSCSNGIWFSDDPHDLSILNQELHKGWYSILTVWYQGEPTLATYSTKGAAQAADFVFGTNNNFNLK